MCWFIWIKKRLVLCKFDSVRLTGMLYLYIFLFKNMLFEKKLLNISIQPMGLKSLPLPPASWQVHLESLFEKMCHSKAKFVARCDVYWWIQTVQKNVNLEISEPLGKFSFIPGSQYGHSASQHECVPPTTKKWGGFSQKNNPRDWDLLKVLEKNALDIQSYLLRRCLGYSFWVQSHLLYTLV